MNYSRLRKEGLNQLERMTEQWTDFNAHDPGITILEQLCYALTDLGYRIDHEIPDLLATGGGDPYESLYPPADILTSRAVTLTDLRKLALDVDGVKNAWLEPAAEELALHYHPGRQELGFTAEPPATQPVRLRGLHRVLIEPVDPGDAALRRRVAGRLHGHRNLCEDFAEIRILEPQPIQVFATVELGRVDDVEQVQLEIFARIADHLSPPIPFRSLEQMLDDGLAVDEIFDGPLLAKGFIDEQSLMRASRCAGLYASDLIQVIMDVAGVRAVRSLRLAAGGEVEPWFLALDANRFPQLDTAGSEIRLERAGLQARVDGTRVAERHRQASEPGSLAPSPPARASNPLAPPSGRDRGVGRYTSVQHHFPDVYGIGEAGLPESATPERKAQARQLKAYLMLFDQFLAGSFAQLAQVGDLFAFRGGDDAPRTYFTQPVDGPGLRLEEIRAGDSATYRQRLESVTEDEGRAFERKNRFLNHLLARFAEQMGDHAFIPTAPPEISDPAKASPRRSVDPASQRIRDKQAFLRHYPRISSARGTGFNLLEVASDDNVSGFEQRLRLKLGLAEHRGETLLLVEHLLLRPMAGDQAQELPMLTEASRPDPYSLQLSLVFPGHAGRLQRPELRRLVERIVRDEVPAHLTPRVHWLEGEDWARFEQAHRLWQKRLRAVRAHSHGYKTEAAGS